MAADFLLVDKAILPASFPKVVQVRELIAKDGVSVSEACKAFGLSRSVYYKYKDRIYAPSGSAAKKAILSIKTEDFPGVLSAILLAISSARANVLTISQDVPIRSLAYIHLMINVRNMSGSLNELLQTISSLPHVAKAEVLAYE